MKLSRAAVVLAVSAAMLCGSTAAVGAPAPAAPAAPDPRTPDRPTDRGDIAPLPEPVPSAEGEHAPDQVLVRWAPRTSAPQRRSALDAAGATSADAVPGTSFTEVAVGDEDPEAVVARLAEDPRVADVQLDHVRRATQWTTDPAVEYTWPYLDLTRLPRAWDASTGTGVIVAVLDTGVSPHPDLAGGVLPGWDFVANDSDTHDPPGHGTLVAGVVAARGNNGLGAVGAAYDAKILPVRVLDDQGEGADSTIAAGIAYAVTEGAQVVNLSLAGRDESPVLLEAIRSAVAAGVVVVAAAGNDGDDTAQYPAAYAPQVDGLLAVSATDDDGALTDFSTWGDWVTLAAPGYQIVGPDRHSGGYVAGSGTSFAAPLVAGAAALLRAHATLTPAQVEERLVQTARDAGPRGMDPYYGFGVLDAATAVTAGDATHAAVAVPLDRAAPDGATDDTPAAARTLAAGTTASGTVAPEGDADWFTIRSTIGWTEVRATVMDPPTGAGSLEPVVQVYDASGTVIGRSLWDSTSRSASVKVQTGDASSVPLAASVTNANGSATTQRYELTVAQAADGRFVRTRTATPAEPQALGLGDVTGDGRQDAVTVATGGSLLVARGRGDGTFAAPTTVPVAGGVVGTDVVVADLDKDGAADVVVPTSTGYAVLLQRSGVLTTGSTIPLTGGGLHAKAADADGDGDADLVVGNTSQPTLAVLLGAGDGTFTAGPVVPSALPGGFVLGDVSSDGRIDVVGTQAFSRQLPDGTFAAPQDLQIYLDGVSGVRVGDVTGDGRADVVRTSRHRVVVQAQLAAGGFAAAVEYAAGELPGSPVLGDVDGDGRLDVLVLNNGWGTMNVLFQRADGTLSAPEVTPVPSYRSGYSQTGLQVADLDVDGRVDAVAAVDALYSFRQVPVRAPGTASWVRGLTPAAHSSGLQRRPTVQVVLERDLAGAVPEAVRLVAQDGSRVDTTTSYDSATRTIRMTPDEDLGAGSHYEVVVDGLTDPVGGTQDTPVRTWFTVAAGGDRFTPVDPVRIADTRLDGLGPVASGEELQLDLSPLPTDATSVVLSVTSAGHGSLGNVRVFPTRPGAPVPTVANLNLLPGVDQPNLVTVAIGDDRSVSLMPDGPTTHLIVDIFGYYSPSGGTAFEPLDPTRVLDTRTGTGARQGPVTGGHWVDLEVAGVGPVPADASAVVLNVAGTGVAGRLFVSVYPKPDAGYPDESPGTSNLNLYPGRDQSNLVTVKIGDGGRIRFWVNTSSTHLVADLAGYYSATGDDGFVPVAPVRMADTRTSSHLPGILRAGVPVDLDLWRSPVGTDATAVVLNIAGVGPKKLTHVRAFPTTVPATLPEISTINLAAGRDESNLAIVRVGDQGRITLYAHSSDTHLVLDAFGYFRTYR